MMPCALVWENCNHLNLSVEINNKLFFIPTGGGYNISPLKPRNGKPRTQVQHLMQIDLKGWGVGYISSFQQHCLLQMLNSVAGKLLYQMGFIGYHWSCLWICLNLGFFFKIKFTIYFSVIFLHLTSIRILHLNTLLFSIWGLHTGLREYFSQTDERSAAPRIPVMVNMTSASVSSKRKQKLNETSLHHHRSPSLDQMSAANRNVSMLDEYSDEDEEYQVADQEVSIVLLFILGSSESF